MLSRDESWARVVTLMHKETGVLLQTDQAYLLDPRVQPVAHANKFVSVEAFVEAACSNTAGSKIRMALVDAMTTHESYFFRDSFFWGALKTDVLPRFRASGRPKIRIWSAACSYGQEAYSVAMMIQEEAPDLMASCEIFASDVSDAALDRGRAGLYSTTEVNRGLAAMRLVRHFDKAPGGFVVKDVIKSRVRWANENILKSSHAANPFDIVLCRNVLIYFDGADRKVALANLLDSTRSGGCIGLGTSETLLKPQMAPGWFCRL